MNLANHHIYLKLMIGGTPSQPFSATALASEGTTKEAFGIMEFVVMAKVNSNQARLRNPFDSIDLPMFSTDICRFHEILVF